MTAPLKPTKACTFCDSTSFGVVDEIWLDLVCDAKKARGNTVHPRFTAIICKGCGQTQLFMKDTEEHLLKTCHHEVVDIANQYPYR